MTHPLTNQAIDAIAAAHPKQCQCGPDREPRSEIRGAFSLTVCARCKGITTPKKD